MMASILQVVCEGPTAKVTLDRPDVHNAFNSELISSITSAFHTLSKKKEVRVIVLSGMGKNFCAGGDLNWMQAAAKLSRKQNELDAKKLHQMFEAISTSFKPVIAKVQGMAFGGGVGLVSAADIVVAAEDCQFGLTEVRLGLIPSVIAPFVIGKIGTSNYNAYAISGKKMSAKDALRMGLVHEVSLNLDLSVQQWVHSILEGAPQAQAQLKTFTQKIATLPLNKAGIITSKMIAQVRVGKEAQEGLAAFLEKRKPNWG